MRSLQPSPMYGQPRALGGSPAGWKSSAYLVTRSARQFGPRSAMARALRGYGLGLEADECVESPIVAAVNEGRAFSDDSASDMDVVKSGNYWNGSASLVGLAGRKQEEVARKQAAFCPAIDAGTGRASLRK